MRIFMLAVLTTGLVASAATARTPLTLTAAISAVEAKGYTVHEIDSEGSRFEVEATTRDGARVELIVDAATAEILRAGVDD